MAKLAGEGWESEVRAVRISSQVLPDLVEGKVEKLVTKINLT